MNAAVKSLLERPSRTKIVATLGPASDSEEMLEKLIIAGVDIFRINAAHGTQDRFAVMVKRIRSVSKKIGLPVGILMDLAGPKIRLGELENGELTLESGSEMAFVSQKFLEKADIICEAFDDSECKAMLVNLVLEKLPDKFLIAASGMAGMGSANTIKTRRVSEKFYICGDETSDVKLQGSLVSSRVMVCAAHQAHTVLRILAEQFET